MSKERSLKNMDVYENDLHQLVINASKGDPVAQNQLGASLATGNGVELNNLGALYWYCMSIKSGYVHAKWNAGSMLVDGEDGVTKNQELGMRLIEEAANANNSSACLFVAQCHRNGTYGKSVDNKLAAYWGNRAWDYKNIKEVDEPLDVFNEYDLKLLAPLVKPTRKK